MSTFRPLAESILAVFPDLAAEDLVFAPPPNLEMGDVALRTFELAKKLKLAPPAIAARIVNEVRFGPEVLEARATGPYVNFRVDRGVLGRGIVASVLREGAKFGSNHSGTGQKVLIEHTSINPNADPHVGRARNAMIGDSLVRILRFEDYAVEVHYYVNDIGRQIALLVLVCESVDRVSFDAILRLYQEANARAEADPDFAAEGYALLARIEQGDEDARNRFRAVTDLCLDGQLAVLARLGIRYDVFDRESDYVRDPRLALIVDALRARDAVFDDEEGRLSVDLAKLGYPYNEGRYIALLRSNGSSMYAYRDMAYTIDKMERGAGINLIVLGEDHRLYFQQLELVLAQAGYKAPEPIYYSYITLSDGKMSTRQGKVVLLSDFLDEATRRAAVKVDEQCKDLDPEERAAIASKVAVAAIRYAILRVSPNKNVVFDWESSLSFTGDTGPYVQYSCARIASILRKFGEVPGKPSGAFPIETVTEWALLSKVASFPDTVEQAVRQRSAAPVAQYASDLARTFTAFYHECPVLDAPSPEQRTARAQVCAATRQTLVNALMLLGIEACERM